VQVEPVNGPLSGNVALTIRGQNFGTENEYRPMVRIGFTSCDSVQHLPTRSPVNLYCVPIFIRCKTVQVMLSEKLCKARVEKRTA